MNQDIYNKLSLEEIEKFKEYYNKNSNLEIYDNLTINELFNESVLRNPDNIALVKGNEKLTYKDMDILSDKVSLYLREKYNIKENENIAIIGGNSFERFINLFAVLKLGCTYVPIEYKAPISRIEGIIKKAECKVVLSEKSFKNINDRLIDDNIIEKENIFSLSKEEIQNLKYGKEKINIDGNRNCYIIFTSGSTGEPKGVKIRDKSVINFSKYVIDKYEIKEEDSVLALSSFAFDASVLDTFPILFVGGTIHIIEDDIRMDINNINKYLESKKITLMFMTTSMYELFDGLDNNSLRIVFTGGEKLNKVSKNNYKLINIYGPTETTVACTMYEVLDKEYENIPIGTSVDNMKILIIDEEGNLNPLKEPGELCVEGIGLSIGYLDNEKETKKRFVPSILDKNRIMYKTGDIAKWNENYEIEFVGRKDEQIKHRGFRIELNEIKKMVMEYKEIKDVAIIYNDEVENKYIACFYCSDKEINNKDIKEFLLKNIPEYMIPNKFIKVNKIPLNNNFKVDKKSLLALIKDKKEKIDIDKKDNNIEEVLKEMWSKMLSINLEDISIDDNFIECGGHSILAIKLIKDINEKYNINLSMIDFLKEPNIKNLEEIINKQIKNYKKDDENIVFKHNEKERFKPFELNDLQQAYLLGRKSEFELGNLATHCYTEFECDDYDHERFKEVIRKVFYNHDMLRCRFSDDGYQYIDENYKLKDIEYNDISNFSKEEQKAFLNKVKEEMTTKIIDYTKENLVQLRVTKIGEKKAIIHFYYDGLVVDGWSQEILFSQTDKLYSNKDYKLPDEKVLFRDYINYLKELKKGNEYEKCKKYWQNRIKDLPPIPDLPTKQNNNSSNKLPEVRKFSRALSIEDYNKLEKISQKNGITVFITLLTVFGKTIARYCNKQRFLINVPEFNRYDVEEGVNNLVGECSSFLLFEIDNRGNKSFLESARDNEKTLWELHENKLFSGADVLKEIAKVSGSIENNYVPIVFTSLMEVHNEYSLKKFKKKYVQTHTSQIWIDSVVMQCNNEVQFNWDCVLDIFEGELLDSMLDTFIITLKELINNEESWTRKNELYIKEEYKKVIEEANNTKHSIKYEKFVDLLENSRMVNEKKIAISTINKSYTYEELFNTVKGIANLLSECGIKKNDNVSILMDKKMEQIASILGVIYCGATYIPITTDASKERLKHCISETESKLLIVDNNTSKLFNIDDIKCKIINIDNYKFDKDYSFFKPIGADLEDNMVIIYTSGSTGMPKGVMVTQRGLINCIKYTNETFNVNKEDKILSLTNYSHDMSVYDILGILSAGGEIVLPEAERVKDPEHWLELIEKHGVTLWNTVPAMMEMMLEIMDMKNEGDISSIRVTIFGGDVLKPAMVKKLRERIKNAKIMNVGGPSETTIWNINHEVTIEDEGKTRIPYGKPIWNTKYFILNENLEICPKGVIGTMFVEGDGVSKGYINNKEKTSQVFITNPYTGNVMYNTGDLGLYLQDGSIDFIGRKDFQVKINGKRIELGEIEYYADLFEGIESAIAKISSEDKKVINLYYKSTIEIDNNTLRKFLEKKIPDYMIPKNYMRIEEIPLTLNGKINKDKLPEIKNKVNVKYDEEKLTSIQKDILEIYKEIINIDSAEINDNFFTLGGDSLKAIKLLRKVSQKYKVSLNLTDIFKCPSIYKLSILIEKNLNETDNYIKKTNKNTAPLSISQEGIWFINKGIDENEDQRYNIISTFEINNNVNLDLLKKSIELVIENNIPLKTVIREKDYKPYQTIDFNGKYEVKIEKKYDYLPNKEIRKIVEAQEAKTHFDISTFPLFNIRILESCEDKNLLVINIHHIIADAYSINIILEKIQEYYKLLKGNENIEKNKDDINYIDYLIWQNEELEKGKYDDELNYWKDKLKGNLNIIDLSEKNITFGSFKGNVRKVNIDEDVIKRFKEICKDNGMTLFAGFTTVLYMFINYLTYESDISIGCGVSGRGRSEIEKTIGNFAGALLLRCNIDENKGFSSIAKDVKKTVDEAYRYQSLPYEKVIKEINLDRQYFTLPYKILIDYIENEDKGKDGIFSSFNYSKLIAPADFCLFIQSNNGVHNLSFTYKEELFSDYEMAEFELLFKNIINEIVKNPEKKFVCYDL